VSADRGPALALLLEAGAHEVRHSGSTLLDHLVGTADLLSSWGVPDHVELAGLMHSVYGTGSFGEAPLGLADRGRVAAAIGADAEHLVDLYCRMDVPFLDDAAAGRSPLLSREDWSELPATPGDLPELQLLVLANRLEQAARLATLREPEP